MGPLTPSETPGPTGSFRPILGAAVFLFIAVLAMAGVKSYRDLEAARRHKDLLDSRIHGTEAEIARLRGKIERLRSDPGTLERLAREDLGMVRPGDVVIELPQDAALPTAPKATPKETPKAAPQPTPAPPAAPPPGPSPVLALPTPVTASNIESIPAPPPGHP